MGGNEDILSSPTCFFSKPFVSRIVGLMAGSPVHDLLFSYSISFAQTHSLKLKTTVKAGTIQPNLLWYWVKYGGATLSMDSIFWRLRVRLADAITAGIVLSC